jgi:predicted CopG family antitoxin
MAADMKTEKESLIELIETLSEKQVEYLRHLAEALFCQTAD